MVEVIRIPKLGLSEYAELVSWEVAVGEQLSKGDVVAILESEKASAEISSPAAGTLLATYVEEGEEIAVEVGRPLGVVGAEGETAPPLEEIDTDAEGRPQPEVENRSSDTSPASGTTDGASARQDTKATPRAKRDAQEQDVDLSEVEGTGPEGAVTSEDVDRFLEEQDSSKQVDHVRATPSAKREARRHDVDLASITDAGSKSAITVDDVERHLESDATATPDETVADETDDLTVVESSELTETRKTIAERLSKSAREKPHVMGTREIRIDRLEDVRDRLDSRYGVEVSLNDLLVYFVGRVLEDLPEFNSHFDDGHHKILDEVNIGYAVDGPRGLIVPVIERVADRSLTELAQERRNLVQSVLDDEHTVADLQGGTFTVTNVGALGMDISYSIINPPEVAILAIGRQKSAPVERDGDVEFEKVITFSLTIDHRVLDGADSGAFLEQLAEYIEYPGLVFDEVSLD